MRYRIMFLTFVFFLTPHLHAESGPLLCEDIFGGVEVPTNRHLWLVDTNKEDGPEFSFISWRLSQDALSARESEWIRILGEVQAEEESAQSIIEQFLAERSDIYGLSEAELSTIIGWLKANHGGITLFQKMVVFDWMFCQFSIGPMLLGDSGDGCSQLAGERWDEVQVLSFLVRIGNRKDLDRLLTEFRLFSMDLQVYKALIPPPPPRTSSGLGQWLQKIFQSR